MSKTPKEGVVRRKLPRKRGALGKVVIGGIQCDACGTVFKAQNGLNKHVRFNCKKGERRKVTCRYCQKKISARNGQFQRHLRTQHPDEELYEWEELDRRELTQPDKDLITMLKQIGDPGGEHLSRDGYLFVFDEPHRIVRYVFEEVDERCMGPPPERRTTVWWTDKLLPPEARVSSPDVRAIRSSDWHFAHMVCECYHNWDPSRNLALKTSSIGCVQNANVNQGAWHQLEQSFRYLPYNGYRVFVFSATGLGEHPEMIGTKKQVAKADSLLKIAVALTHSGQWLWDAYLIPNREDSRQSPNAYRVSETELDEFSEFRFLYGIRSVMAWNNLYEEGNAAKNRWLAEHPSAAVQAPSQELQDSAIGMDFDSQQSAEVHEDATDTIRHPRDKENAELKTEVQQLKQQLSAALARIAELEGRNEGD